MNKPAYKIIQIIAETDIDTCVILTALCSDGTIWQLMYDADTHTRFWHQVVYEDRTPAECRP